MSNYFSNVLLLNQQKPKLLSKIFSQFEIMSEQNEKMKALKATIERLEKTYGKGVVMKMDDTRSNAVDVVSTGSFGLDLAMGVGGFPRAYH